MKATYREKLNLIVKDDYIYPRVQVSPKTIDEYVEAIKAGAEFPPITVQKISSDNKVSTICLDGWHRVQACREYNRQAAKEGWESIDQVEVTDWKTEVLDRSVHLVALMIKSYELNAKQGLRLSHSDAKSQLEKIASDPDALSFNWKDIARRFEVTPQWVSRCVSPMLARKKMGRNALIYKLSLLGWSQSEIGEFMRMAQPHVSENIRELNNLKIGIIRQFKAGQLAEKIADFYNLDVPLSWAIFLEGKDDIERFRLFQVETSHIREELFYEPEITDFWDFPERDPRLGDNYSDDNEVPGQMIMNLLFYFSRQGDLVIDPMTNGGTTLDACLVMNRRCKGFNVVPLRSDIEKAECDIREKFPKKAKGCNLIILNPPYYKRKQKLGYADWTTDRNTFMDSIADLAKSCYDALREDGRVALAFGHYVDWKEGKEPFLDIVHLVKPFERAGFKCFVRIAAPMTFEFSEEEIREAQERKQLLPVCRDWLIFKKVITQRGVTLLPNP